jgi:putative inorganic carbon (HCO3(-)) transporter
VGVNTFSKNYAKYKLEEAEQHFPTQDTTYTHNMYLQMAGEIGLLGLLAFLWLLFRFFKDNLKTYGRLKDHFLRVTCISLFACVLAFLINGMTETSLYYSRISMVFWFLLGFSLSLGKFVQTDE